MIPEEQIILSVITPVFNGCKYIENCLENVAKQVFPGLEHVIMDGGSTDGTVELILSRQDQFPHIRLISEKDRGQSDAMNKGILSARGSIIGFLNVDDYYEPNVLKRIPELFSDFPEPAFICGNLNIWNADGSLKHFNRPNRITLPELLSGKFEWPYNPSAYFYHKSLHNLAGMYNETNHYCMDYEFVIEVALRIPLIHIDELWGNFCQVDESKTKQRFLFHQKEAAAEGAALRQKALEKLDKDLNQKVKDLIDNHSTPAKSGKPSFTQRVRKLLESVLR